jgi:hypothetical protein
MITDFYHRKIILLWLVLFGACNIVAAIVLYGLKTFGLNVLFNIAVLIYMFLGVTLYVYIKTRKISLLKHYTGAGDVLFFIALIPIFEFYYFIYFLIASCLAGLFWWIIVYVFSNKKRTVPFVGVSGCILLLYIIINVLR